MKNTNLKLSVLVLAIAVVILGASIWVVVTNKTAPSAQAQQELMLNRPAFLSAAGAAATTLDNEAGMSIYLNAGKTLNLAVAYNAMQVEQNTSNYVIGTLDARMQTGLDSDDFPHCFVAAQGWIIVYYLKINTANPSTTGWLGKIIDWSLYTNNQLSGNYLSEGLTYIANQLSIVVANSQYYHFQYPNATKLLLAIKHASNGATSTFNIEVPSSFTVKERSWSCYCNSYNGYTFKIDSSVINSTSYIGRNYGGPEIWTTILTPDVFHTVSITCKDDGWSSHYANACLLLIYQ